MNQRYRRRPRRWSNRLFDDLPPEKEAAAWGWIARWRAQRNGYIPRWLWPKLTERAYRFAEDPSTPYRLAGAAGGHALARKYPGKLHPIHNVREKLLAQQRTEKEEREREILGLPPRTKHKVLPIG